MLAHVRTVALILAGISLVFFVACSSSGPKAQTVPSTPVEPTTAPVTEPSMSEEVISERPTQPMVSEQPMVEELPEDLVILNARGYLDDVFFETDRYELENQARDHLAANAKWLRQYADVKILVEGHCDERNTREYNLALGERRANAVRDYLVFLGIDPNRVQTISYGEERPFSLGRDEAAWNLNRRAHFVITAR
ncbi:MAG: peptidoglycan-associated lipoprotein Pal [Thermoanaerobaculales bacterium]|nr:peptidoglycan-associated lipoprotein Pal [Thermoanaerobaculales bacterium]